MENFLQEIREMITNPLSYFVLMTMFLFISTAVLLRIESWLTSIDRNIVIFSNENVHQLKDILEKLDKLDENH